MEASTTPTVGSTPIACDMTNAPDTPQERMAEYGQLFARHLVGRDRSTDGIRFRLDAADGVEAWVRDLSAREKACCPFADFTVVAAGGQVHWDITVLDDPTARAVLAEFYNIPETVADGIEGMRRRLTDLGFVITTNDTATVTTVRPGG